MNVSAATVLVSLVFAAQILVLSAWVPYMFHKAYSRLKETYPPSAYPRLYPVSPGEVGRFNAVLLVVRAVVVLGSTSIFALDLVEGHGPSSLARTLVWVLLAQAVPALIRLPWQLRVARAFRALPPPPVRSAELRLSRLTEFVPLPLILAGITGAAISLAGAIALYASNPDQSRVMTLYVSAVSAWLLLRMLVALRAPGSIPRPDPYMTDADVFRARRQRLRMLFTVAAVAGVGFIMLLLFKAGRLPVDMIAICVGCSILCQLVYLGAARVVLRTLKLRDASVYRAEAT